MRPLAPRMMLATRTTSRCSPLLRLRSALGRSFFARRSIPLAKDATEDRRTVETAIKEYFLAREGRGSKGARADRYVADARILPALGSIEIDKLSANRIRDWLSRLAEAPKLLRTPRGANERRTKNIEASDADAVRARRATANRVLTILKAALNHAFAEGHAVSDEAWRKVKPFREADAPVVRFLTVPSANGSSMRATRTSASLCKARCSRAAAMASWSAWLHLISTLLQER